MPMPVDSLMLPPISLVRGRRSGQYNALAGSNITIGVIGFGPTPEAALAAFFANWTAAMERWGETEPDAVLRATEAYAMRYTLDDCLRARVAAMTNCEPEDVDLTPEIRAKYCYPDEL